MPGVEVLRSCTPSGLVKPKRFELHRLVFHLEELLNGRSIEENKRKIASFGYKSSYFSSERFVYEETEEDNQSKTTQEEDPTFGQGFTREKTGFFQLKRQLSVEEDHTNSLQPIPENESTFATDISSLSLDEQLSKIHEYASDLVHKVFQQAKKRLDEETDTNVVESLKCAEKMCSKRIRGSTLMDLVIPGRKCDSEDMDDEVESVISDRTAKNMAETLLDDISDNVVAQLQDLILVYGDGKNRNLASDDDCSSSTAAKLLSHSDSTGGREDTFTQ
ncbi:hypothetical protein Ciccas_003382 [Cichlidogyrus casuarinus]|uniref:Uncharacterized protein n=1 Tax=Cichlidogyrus casuarinus TaxID=1844966 RepID=A0ABD2QEK3_9PLAT